MLARHPWRFRALALTLTVGLLAVLAGCASHQPPAPAATASGASPVRPNVIVVLVDDLGWADTGPYGSRFHDTPALDRLAREGTRFTQFYAASPVCSPTRSSLMTGRHPARLHITDWIGGDDTGPLLPPAYQRFLPLSEFTIGEAFQFAGYATGYIGKWHLGDGPFVPSAQGFLLTKAVNRAGQPATYAYPYQGPTPRPTSVPDLEGGTPGEYLTDRLTDEALAFIDAHRAGPFFLYLAHYAVHTPLEAPAPDVAAYAAKAAALPDDGPAVEPEGTRSFTTLRQRHPTYAAMVNRTDTSVGRILERLSALGLSERTIVVFTSDNGGLSTLMRASAGPTSNAPLRSGKGWLYEGGIRIPFVVRWPGALQAGRVVDVPAQTTDLYPTLLGLAGLPARPAQHLDGADLSGVLRGGGHLAPRDLFWHFPHYHGSGHTPSGAVRSGSLKLIEWFGEPRVELYDLAADPGERTNLAAARPADVRALRQTLDTWRGRVRAQMPSPNPGWSRGADAAR